MPGLVPGLRHADLRGAVLRPTEGELRRAYQNMELAETIDEAKKVQDQLFFSTRTLPEMGGQYGDTSTVSRGVGGPVAATGGVQSQPFSYTPAVRFQPVTRPQGMPAFATDEDWALAQQKAAIAADPTPLSHVANVPAEKTVLAEPPKDEFDGTFGEAFSSAEKAGLSEFGWQGKRYAVRHKAPSKPMKKWTRDELQHFAMGIGREEEVNALGEGWHEIWLRQIRHESNWNPKAVSSAGAKGLGQFIDSTWRDMEKWGIKGDPFDPEQNLRASIRYLKIIANDLNTTNPAALLASYNWGPGNVQKRGLSVMPKETRQYLYNILGKEQTDHLINQYEHQRRQARIHGPKR